MCEACAAICHRLAKVEKRLAYCEELNLGWAEVKETCRRLGVAVEAIYDNPPGHTPNLVRDQVIAALAVGGWPAAKIGSVLRMSERSIRRVLARNRGTTCAEKVAAGMAGHKVGADGAKG